MGVKEGKCVQKKSVVEKEHWQSRPVHGSDLRLGEFTVDCWQASPGKLHFRLFTLFFRERIAVHPPIKGCFSARTRLAGSTLQV